MRSRKRNNLKLILVIILLTISLGYALLQADLTINGTSKISATSWNVYFDNIQVTSGSAALQTGDSIPTINATTLTDITYTVTLKEPGEFYEFTVDVVNDGTLDAMIGTITNKLNGNEISTTNPLPVYLSYSVTYSDNTPIASNHLLEKNSTETYKVRLAFRTDINPSDLPTSGATNTLSFGISYVQSDSSSIPVPHPTPIYTLTPYDSENSENTTVQLGSAIPTSMTKYNTSAQARAALNTLAGGEALYPFYAKHMVAGDTVIDTYVEFVVTSIMANADSHMTEGIYDLRGAGSTNCTYNNETYKWICDEPSLYYEDNKLVLLNAFGSANCWEEETSWSDQGKTYRCAALGLRIAATEYGNITVSHAYQNTNSCIINPGGLSTYRADENEIVIPGFTGTGAKYVSNWYFGEVFLGMPIPYDINDYYHEQYIFDSISDYRTANPNDHFLFKHTVVNSVITESYLTFIVTDEMVEQNSGMTLGVYNLRGAGGINCTTNHASMNPIMGCEGPSPYYESNKQILLAAFGSSLCNEDSNGYHCSANYNPSRFIGITAYKDGRVSAGNGSGGCGINVLGISYCSD